MAENTSGAGAGAEEQWFGRKNLDVLIYKVNRRPIGGDPMLFAPPAAIGHLMDTLRRQVEPVISGRRFQREWRVGNLVLDEASGVITGMIGWSRSNESLTNIWDEETKSWRERVVSEDFSGVSPFVFSSGRRFLGVLKHPTFDENTVSLVFTEILNRVEQARSIPWVQWAVEPVGNEDEFYSWLEDVDQVVELKFTFQRPNPDAEKSFENLFQRLDRMKAEKIRESITARDPAEGLDKAGVRDDPTTQGFLRAAMSAFGLVVGRGIRKGKPVNYDQRNRVLRERVEDVGTDWRSATFDVKDAVNRAERRQGPNG